MEETEKLEERIEQLKRIIEQLDRADQVESLLAIEKGIRDRDEYIAQKEEYIAQLEERLQLSDEKERVYRSRMFGSSSEQTKELDEPVENETGTQEATNEEAPPRVRGRKLKGKRESELSELEQERMDHELPEGERICPVCGSELREIGSEHVRNELIYVHGHWRARRHYRHNYGCDHCRNHGTEATIVHAPIPLSPIPNSLWSASAASYIMYEKYINAMPLYRISKALERDGVVLDTALLSRWVIMPVELWLVTIFNRMHELILLEDILHGDETTFQVNKEPGREPHTDSYMWLVRTAWLAEHPIILYFYFPTRRYENAKEILKEFKGYLLSDGYEAYLNLPEGVINVLCWYHVRHYFMDALKAVDKNRRKGSKAEKGIQFINKLFELEREYTKEGLTPEERLRLRLKRSKPISDEFFAWSEEIVNQPKVALPKSYLGKAVRYALNHRRYLENFYLDGRLELSNNRAENSIRPFVIGRKNWLFSDTPGGAKASQVLYSILLTAEANGLHPRLYMEYLLKCLPSSKLSELDNFLPWSTSLPDSLRLPVRQCPSLL